MLGLFFIYFIGKAYYNLADQYQKQKKWIYAFLGVASYYLGTFLLGIGFGLLGALGVFVVEDIDEKILGIMALPGGALLCWGTYKLLEGKWKKENTNVSNPDILDNEVDLI